MAKCQEMFDSHFTREHALDEEPENLVPATAGGDDVGRRLVGVWCRRHGGLHLPDGPDDDGPRRVRHGDQSGSEHPGATSSAGEILAEPSRARSLGGVRAAEASA